MRMRERCAPNSTSRIERRRVSAWPVIAFSAFAVWTVTVMTAAVSRADWATTLLLQRSATAVVDRVASLVTGLGNVETAALLMLVIALVMSRSGHSRASLEVWAIFVGGSVLEVIGKHWLPHAGVPPWLRRPLLNHWHYAWNRFVGTSYGYPSGHAFRTVLMAGAVWRTWSPRDRWRRLLRSALVAVVMLMGAALIYLGDHWMSEVIGGCLLGAAGVGLLGTDATSAPLGEGHVEMQSRGAGVPLSG